MWYAFIQPAGFTIGKTQSQFSAPSANHGVSFDGLPASGWEPVNQFTYTADFGQCITASFSAQDAWGTSNV